jgi:hypothetical protein
MGNNHRHRHTRDPLEGIMEREKLKESEREKLRMREWEADSE